MPAPVNRRTLLKAAAASTLFSAIAGRKAQADDATAGPAAPVLKFDTPEAFSFDTLKEMARDLLRHPYKALVQPAPDIVGKIDYAVWGQITFDTDASLFADGPGSFPVTFFHLGTYFRSAVQVHAVENGMARRVIYDRSYFHMPAGSIARQLPADVGFAGFRVQEARDGKLDWHTNDWAAFLGASYFRAIGALQQYGLSARGVAIDTAVDTGPEDFPIFTDFYIESMPGTDSITVYALLDGASVVGAYKFLMSRAEGVIMDVDCMLALRREVTRFGVAPLTSMFWYSETEKPTAIDWRPEVHDSDGLAMLTGWGEHIWRPFNNPPATTASAFLDENPGGFGVLQRDRDFDHYQDGVHYERRPSLWVEPKGAWGKGAVQLVEIPINDEVTDNIVAMWVPATLPGIGEELDFSYRLYWEADEPHPAELARVIATRLGRGGPLGGPHPADAHKFVVEFLGGPLTTIPSGKKPTLALQASRGHFTNVQTIEAVPDNIAGHWRAEFDLADIDGLAPVDMQLILMIDGKPASETWLYQYHPSATPAG